MDLLSILSSVITSTTVLGLFMYYLQKRIDKKFTQIEKQQQLILEETYRRKKLIYDTQFNVYKVAVALTYQLRNAARNLKHHLENNLSNVEDFKKKLYDLYECNDNLQEQLYHNRLLLPEVIFRSIHDIKVSTDNFAFACREAFEIRSDNNEFEKQKKEIDKEYDIINQSYFRITSVLQASMEIEMDKEKKQL